MAHWTLQDIAWDELDRSKATPELISVVKAASMVEHNGHEYARYLCEVFSDDPVFQQAAKDWAEEEVQHGKALRQWAELADPTFDFDKSFAVFTAGYTLPLHVTQSVRGSRSGELAARCMVEIGTSSYYTAIKEYTDEPVLKVLCAKIAADEFRHYKLFYTHLKRYLDQEHISSLQRLKVVLGRIAESEDDELAYAFYATHADGRPYERKVYIQRWLASLGSFYRKEHVELMVSMVLKAVGLSRPSPRLNKCLSFIAWNFMQLRVYWSGTRLQPAL